MKNVIRRCMEIVLYPILDHYMSTRAIPLIRERMIKNTRMQQTILGSWTTAQYIADHMSGATIFEDRDDGLKASLDEVTWDGLYLEFGVFTGSSINLIADTVKKTVHGFDSFKGLPENWHTGYAKGSFAMNDDWRPQVRSNVQLHVGTFDEVLPGFVEEFKENVCFLHVDCDLYSSTKTLFEHLGERITHGTVIVFDEYFNYPNWQAHEYKAFQEFAKQRGLSYEYIGYSSRYTQVAVRVLSKTEMPSEN